MTSGKLATNAVATTNVIDAAITTPKLADGAVTTAKLAANAVTGVNVAAGSITANQLAAGAALTNLQSSGQIGVASGGIVLSAQANATNLLNAGYIQIPSLVVQGTVDKIDQRASLSFPNPFSPQPRAGHTAVWDGSEMIVWGGSQDGSDVNTGGRYNPATDSWIPTPATNGIPAAGSGHTAVWSGTEMIVWGGSLGNQGWRYNPVSNSWVAATTVNAPVARSGHVAVWNGTNMLVWGGSYYDTNLSQTVYLNTGARYTPTNDTWVAISTTGAPSPRTSPLAVWAGHQPNAGLGWPDQ